ncbi:hypothetical protein [Jeotgalibaca porci]|uniref:hypothetical protein n=1 Tax=Jeotgalibaca porci TaxID=1868793 RepID=UPI0035A03AB4
MNNGKELTVYLKEKIEGYASDVFFSDRDNDNKNKVFFNKLSHLNGYFDETEYTKEWYSLAFNAAINGDNDAMKLFNI